MTPEQFTYWLQGFFEISNPEKLDEKQTQIIKDHLDLVFDKQTPDRNKTDEPKATEKELKPRPGAKRIYCSGSGSDLRLC